MFGLSDAALGAIFAALITALVSLIGLIISKEQKVSEFRQAWIDALREEIGSLIGHASTIVNASLRNSQPSGEGWKTERENYLCANEALAKIRLRLNQKEAESSLILKSLAEYEECFAYGKTPNAAQVAEIEKKMVADTRIVLKQEWMRVRRGERTYRIAKGLAALIAIACAFALLVLPLCRIIYHTHHP